MTTAVTETRNGVRFQQCVVQGRIQGPMRSLRSDVHRHKSESLQYGVQRAGPAAPGNQRPKPRKHISSGNCGARSDSYRFCRPVLLPLPVEPGGRINHTRTRVPKPPWKPHGLRQGVSTVTRISSCNPHPRLVWAKHGCLGGGGGAGTPTDAGQLNAHLSVTVETWRGSRAPNPHWTTDTTGLQNLSIPNTWQLQGYSCQLH